MPKPEQNLIPSGAADRLIAAHDGDVALLYIWLSRPERFDADRAARELCRTAAEINSAYEKLCRMGLSGAKPAEAPLHKLPPAEELPEYTAEDIVKRSEAAGGFKAVGRHAQRKLG